MSFSLASLSVAEEHSISLISPVASGPCDTGFMAEETSRYFTCFLYFRFILKIKTNTSTIKSNNK